jgi:hypothetical protein
LALFLALFYARHGDDSSAGASSIVRVAEYAHALRADDR